GGPDRLPLSPPHPDRPQRPRRRLQADARRPGPRGGAAGEVRTIRVIVRHVGWAKAHAGRACPTCALIISDLGEARDRCAVPTRWWARFALPTLRQRAMTPAGTPPC